SGRLAQIDSLVGYIRVIDVFVDELDLAELGFQQGRPRGHRPAVVSPSVLLKLYIHGYLNRVQSSRRLTQGGSAAKSRSTAAIQVVCSVLSFFSRSRLRRMARIRSYRARGSSPIWPRLLRQSTRSICQTALLGSVLA